MKLSRSADVTSLIEALGSTDEVRRETAIARLAVIGGRAVDRLLAAYASAPRDRRVSILRALEPIADPRALPVAQDALRQGGDVAVAAASALRPLLNIADNRTSTRALDALVEAALDASRERRVRLAAFEALAEMPEPVRGPLAAALHKEGGFDTLGGIPSLTGATWLDAVEGRLPESPAAARDALIAHGDSAPLGTLQKLVETVRAREEESGSPVDRDGWRQVRGAIHQALGLRASRVALYDLRETLASTRDPLPATFLAALNAVGDDSCLEPLAVAWTAAPADSGRVWRHQLESTFAAIVKREHLTKRSGVLKRVLARWPGIMPLRTSRPLSMPSRTRPRRATRHRT